MCAQERMAEKKKEAVKRREERERAKKAERLKKIFIKNRSEKNIIYNNVIRLCLGCTSTDRQKIYTRRQS